jgi:2-succinyl-5-enolpyruvyl-6-hydroxy-3-cyclohexene-1-carboxylate synthase
VDPSNRNTALASAFAEELARCGLRHAVVAPGSRSTPLALALWRQEGVATRVIVDERSAAFFALGAAQATGAPVAVVCTSGTAAANLHPAVCEADESASPLLVLTSDRPPELRGVGAGQTIDQLKLYGDAVRWFCEMGSHEADDSGLLHLRSTACRAFAVAAGQPRPGPVHLNFAWRDPLGDEPVAGAVSATSQLALEGRDRDRPLTAATPLSAGPDEFVLAELARHVSDADRPLIVAGRQADPGLAAPLSRLAAAGEIPLLAEPTSQLRFGPHDRSRVISAYDLIARTRPAELAPDLVLRFGEMPTSKTLREWLASLEDAAQLVVDASAGWNEPTRRAAVMVRADPAELAAGLAERIAAGDGGWAQRWLGAESAAREAADAELDAGGLTEPAAHRALAAAYADGDLVYTASSLPIRDQEGFAVGSEARVLFLANRGANGIDGLVSSGIGAAVAADRPAWILTGDLGLYHDLNALSLLRGSETPIRVVVLNNGGGGIFEFLPQAGQLERDEFEPLFGTATGLDPERAAALWGIPYRRAEAPGDVAGESRTELIEVPTDRRAGVELRRTLTRAATGAVAGALSASG